MRTKAVYFSTGEIIEYGGSKRRLKRIIQTHKRLTDEPVRYWFRPCDAWIRASEKYLALWRRIHTMAADKAIIYGRRAILEMSHTDIVTRLAQLAEEVTEP